MSELKSRVKVGYKVDEILKFSHGHTGHSDYVVNASLVKLSFCTGSQFAPRHIRQKDMHSSGHLAAHGQVGGSRTGLRK